MQEDEGVGLSPPARRVRPLARSGELVLYGDAGVDLYCPAVNLDAVDRSEGVLGDPKGGQDEAGDVHVVALGQRGRQNGQDENYQRERHGGVFQRLFPFVLFGWRKVTAADFGGREGPLNPTSSSLCCT